MRSFLFFIFSTLCIAGNAQEPSWAFENNMPDSSEHYVFGDTVFVRSGSSLQSGVIDTLYAGDDILLVKRTEVNTPVKGFTAPWAIISYKKNGERRNGYVWSGLLSFNPMRRGSTKFIFGFDRRWKDEKNNGSFYYTGLLKVVENGKIIAKSSYKIYDGESLSFIEGKILPPSGLDSVKYIVDLFFSGESCGVDAYNIPFAWTGNKLVAMPVLISNGDADVYWHNERFIFPTSKGGISKTLVIDIETGEQTETPDAKGGYKYSIEGEKKYYGWNGNTLKLIKTVPKKKKITSVLP